MRCLWQHCSKQMVLVAGLGGRVGKHNLATHTTLVACGLLGFQRSARACGLRVAGSA